MGVALRFEAVRKKLRRKEQFSMKHTKKRVAALLLTLAMVLSLMPMAFAADEYSDMPAEDDASYAAVKSAVDNGIISGENGNLNLGDNIIRSTMAAMVTRTFGAKGETTLSGYSDVDDSHWAVKQGALPAAVQMGIMNGSNGKMLANDPVTREQAWAMLARALKLEKGTAADLEGIPGADSLSTWAIPEIASLVKAQYISDVSDATEPMTRVEFAEVIYSVSGGNYVKEDGEYTEDVNGNIIITADNVSLKGITVKGDVIIADGVDAGSINLDGVKIEGRLLVRGGSEVALTNGTTAASTVVAKTSDEVTVSADKASDAGAITVDAKADKVTVDMPEPNVTVASATEVAVQNAEGGSVTLAASGASVAVESGTLENVTVANGAADVKVDVAKDATIENVTTNTDLTVTGEGTVSEVTGSGVVSDEAGEVIGGGDDEPAVVPTVVSGGSTASEEGPAAPAQTAHVHNYAVGTGDGEDATQLNATHHLVKCIDKDAVTDEDGNETAAAIVGCGAVVAMPHTPDGDGVCTACGYVKQKVTTSAVTKGDEDLCENNAHTWGADEDNEDTTATCTTDGVKYEKCEDCGATRTITTTASGHNYLLYNSKEATETKTATCAEDGKQSFKCTKCDDVQTETILASSVAHTYSTSEVTTPATCKAVGTRTWTCSVCQGTTTEEIPVDANAHNWNAWTSATVDGVVTHTRTCANDTTNHKQTHTAAPAASWSSNDTNHWHVCTVAGCTQKVGDAAHAYAEGGKTCTSCGKPKPATPAHEHNSQGAQMYDDEKHWNKCDGSEADCASQKLNATNHTWKSGDTAATTANGKCTGCEKTHTCDTSAEGACSKCGYKAPAQQVTD